MKRLNKEYKLDVCNHIIVKYGSVNKDDPQVIYVNGRCWVSPKYKMDYDSVIGIIEKDMRRNIKLFLADGVNFRNRFILDFDINSEKMNVGEKKYLAFDLFLRQDDTNKKSLKGLRGLLNGKISTIANNLVYLFKENDFTIEKTKNG